MALAALKSDDRHPISSFLANKLEAKDGSHAICSTCSSDPIPSTLFNGPSSTDRFTGHQAIPFSLFFSFHSFFSNRPASESSFAPRLTALFFFPLKHANPRLHLFLFVSLKIEK